MGLWNSWPTSRPRDLIEMVFRVLDFDRNATTIDEFGNVRAKSKFKPYGFLKVESPALERPVKLPVIHRDDFLLASFFFDDPTLTEIKDEKKIELLVTYTPEQADKRGFSMSPIHCLHYAICKYGTLEKYYSKNERMSHPEPELIFGPFIYAGELRLHENLVPKL